MTFAEFLMLMPLIIEAAKAIPEVAELIRRAEAGEKITPEEVEKAMAAVDDAVKNWDATESG